MALIDILMPVRNAERFLNEAVESLLVQTFSDWSLIAVDDNSTDNTWGMLCTMAKKDQRILCLKSEGSGIVRALNTSLAHSRAPFLVRMDADDISIPYRFEKLMRLAEEDPEAGVVGSTLALFPAKAVTPNMKRYIDWQNSLLTSGQIRRERYVESTMTHATAMFRREVLIRAQGWREGPFPEDLDLWLRLHRAGVKITKHPETLYLWREHENRETRISDRCSPEAFHGCKVHHLSLELKDRSIGRLTIIGPLETTRKWGQSMEREGFEVVTSNWNPGKPFPEEVLSAGFVLAAFGVPKVRRKAREQLESLGEENENWLFVG